MATRATGSPPPKRHTKPRGAFSPAAVLTIAGLALNARYPDGSG